jgi:murein DD-endopeptidase MepM/ murein hydrolase activator NlpD
MSKTYYTIQIIPEGSTQIKTYRISRFVMKLFAWLFSLIIIFSAIIMWKLVEINAMLTTSRYLKTANERLITRHTEYEAAFEELDSIYAMERQIHNILETYLENDSNKIISILDRNRFKHVPSQKTRLDMDRIWDENQESTSNLDRKPNILPVVGMISKKFDEEKEHFGIDFAATLHEPVFATASGKVVSASEQSELGKLIEIDHGNGLITRYGHLSSYYVRKGSAVRKGETIGAVGVSGKTTGPHLHYEIILNGKHVNPENYFTE